MSETLLKIDHLTHRFGGLQALTDINVEIKKGSINALIGPNGAGKTTVFNLVSGFYVPSEGDIVLTEQGSTACARTKSQTCRLGALSRTSACGAT